MRAIVPRQLSSSIRAQPTIDCAVHLVESILCVSVALLHIVTSPNKIVGGTTASKSFKRNLIGLFVSTVRNCWTWPKISQLGKPPRQQMGHIILHVFPRRLLPQQLPQQSSQFACVRINFNIPFDIHTTGYNRAICSCKPRGLAKTYKMNGGKQKKKSTKWSGCVHQPALCNTPTFCWEVIIFCRMLDVYLFLSIYCACMFGFWARKKCIIL